VPVPVRFRQAVEFRERDGFDDGEAFARAVGQIGISLLAIQPVKEFPRGIAKIEKRTPGRLHQVAVILADFERQGGLAGDANDERQGEQRPGKGAAEKHGGTL
jgi:hypothetical protein